MPKKILIVDDNVDSRELVVKILKHSGYQTVEAVDGEDALEKAVEERPDLILMDRSLPKIDGYEVTRRLKNQKALKDTPIVALTAHAMRGDREKALEAGCEGYISKPINVRALPEQVKAYLQGKRERSLGG
ncbi:MAG: response regulator [Deltaproteobacteria bacterium]|nr:response regulator [Deltaproteobacteria bacterium]MBW2194940.1 response regulator [Deltaproteobacteria bacterium]OEU44808.1 MAG: two-component system response regulator [Desulfobacterales bacterium S7086C20]